MRAMVGRLVVVGLTAAVLSACASLTFGTPDEPETFLRTVELPDGKTEVDSYILTYETQNTGSYLHTIVASGNRFGNVDSMVSGEFVINEGADNTGTITFSPDLPDAREPVREDAYLDPFIADWTPFVITIDGNDYDLQF